MHSHSLNRMRIDLEEMMGGNDPFRWVTMNIYPNPSQGSFDMTYDFAAPAELKIFDLYGKMVHTQSVKSNSGKLSVKNLRLIPGIYEAVIVSDLREIARSKLLIVK